MSVFSESFDNLKTYSDDLSRLTDDELLKLYRRAELVRSEYDNLQLVVKCDANSLYGVQAYAHFSMRDCNNAEDITVTGSHLTRLVDRQLNYYFEHWSDTHANDLINSSKLFPKICKLHNLKYVKDSKTDICVYGDTDSRYIDIEQIFNLMELEDGTRFKLTQDDVELKNQILWFVDNIIMSCVNETIKNESDFRNVRNKGYWKMAHETITRRSALLKKKRYVMTIIWKDGKLFSTPKLKYTGVEIKRGSMSPLSKKLLKKLLDNFLIHQHTQEQLRKDMISICNHIKNKRDKNYIYLITSVTFDDNSLKFENGQYKTSKNHIQFQILANWANFINDLKAIDNQKYGHLKLPFSGQKVNYYYTQNSKYKVIGVPDDVDFEDIPELPEPDWNLMLFHVIVRPFLKYLTETDVEITEKYAQNFMAGYRSLM
jgi:DNA polymerase elongation subunit (family B)